MLHLLKKAIFGSKGKETFSFVMIPPLFVFASSVYLPHAGAAYQGSSCLSHHLFFSPPIYDIRDRVVFAYEVTMRAAAYGFRAAWPKVSLHPRIDEVLA